MDDSVSSVRPPIPQPNLITPDVQVGALHDFLGLHGCMGVKDDVLCEWVNVMHNLCEAFG